jgi:quinol monooxygenase YgiN
MQIFQFHHYIKPEFVEAYRAAILENARITIHEAGVLRFDVFQDQEDPTHFSLLEIYEDQAAREFHLQTEHFLKWKETVLGQEMFARKGSGDNFEMVFPEGNCSGS